MKTLNTITNVVERFQLSVSTKNDMNSLDRDLQKAIRSENLLAEGAILVKKINLKKSMTTYECQRLEQINHLNQSYIQHLERIDHILLSLEIQEENGEDGVHPVSHEKLKERLQQRRLHFLSKLGCRAPNKRVEFLKKCRF